MNLRLLEIFRAVMQSQTTTGAARFLQISQPAVSAAIKQLEKQLEFTLFDRLGNRIVPTEEARILFHESEPIFILSKALQRTAEDLKEHRLGSLRVFATPQLGHTILPRALKELLTNRPKIKTTLDVRRSYSVVEAVQSGAADVGFAIALEKELSQVLSIIPIATVEMVCLLLKNHPLANKTIITPADLTGHALIGLEMGARLGPLVFNAFRESGIPYKTVIDVRYSETACLLAKEGAGVAIVDRLSASSQLTSDLNMSIIPFSPTLSVYVSAVLPKEKKPSYLAKKLVESMHHLVASLEIEEEKSKTKRN